MTNAMNHPRIEMVDPTDLKIAPTHARKHSDKQIEQIARVIDRVGFIVPIIVADDGVIVAGVGRLKAALRRKLDLVPAISVKFVSEADARAFAVADNRLAELSEWDEALLKLELEYLFEQDYDLSLTGFDLGDLDLGVIPDEPEPPLIAPSSDGLAVSRPGDLWLIGPHRLYCGNAREAVSYEALLGDERARMVFSDPPYNVPIAGHVSGLGQTTHREFLEGAGELTSPEFTTFLRQAFRLCARFSVGGSIHYHCMDWRHMREMLDASEGIYSFKQLVVWIKQAGMGSFYRSSHELIFVFKLGSDPHVNTFGLGDKGRYRTNVWDVAGVTGFSKSRARDLADHPTVKPVALVADAIIDCSHRGDLILDPFSGSGTTLLAAHRTGRRGAAIELDPLYVDVSLKRLTQATGLVPKLASGETFEEVAARRAAELEAVEND